MEDKKLYSPSTIKIIMEKYGFNFSKKLGQNFLIDKNTIENICIKSDIDEKDGIIEIGPGIGVLSYELCKRAKKVVLIELDKRLIPILEENLEEFKNKHIIQADVLNIDLKKVIEDEFISKGIKTIKVVANLPYYITTPIIMKLLEDNLKIDSIIVMIQKEVAERLVSEPGKKEYGSITVSVKYYSEPNIVLNVPSAVFMPRPKVDSSVVRMKIKKEKDIELEDEKFFFKVIKLAFGQRRKTLLNTLSNLDDKLEKQKIKKILEENGVESKRRGETLSLKEFALVSNLLKKEI